MPEKLKSSPTTAAVLNEAPEGQQGADFRVVRTKKGNIKVKFDGCD
jgi:hypothetical protein